jgi:hypothetical protein
MTLASKPAIKRSPIFGIFSILASVVGLICLWTARDHAGTIQWCILTATPIVVIGFVVGAWIRSERYLALRFIGLLLSMPILFVILRVLAFLNGLG